MLIFRSELGTFRLKWGTFRLKWGKSLKPYLECGWNGFETISKIASICLLTRQGKGAIVKRKEDLIRAAGAVCSALH
jgi:hypothetical protein